MYAADSSDYNRCTRCYRGFLMVMSMGDEVLGIHIGPAATSADLEHCYIIVITLSFSLTY